MLAVATVATTSFNSRTLGRVRRTSPSDSTMSRSFQFTHPGKGATDAHTEQGTGKRKFQFTHPGKGATVCRRSKRDDRPFQFTHPGKGATCSHPRMRHSPQSFNSRTLGRVRRVNTILYRACEERFNSRTLGRVRLDIHPNHSQNTKFQFTHPGKGATKTEHTDSIILGVSIHAPWEGCDARVLWR